MAYFVKTPWWLKKLYNECIWDIKTKEKNLYLTFDDGPHPLATPYVLEQLKNYNAKATFFCIGKNAKEYSDVYKKIIDEGHSFGNHTYNHLNGWKEKDETYLQNIYEAKKIIESKLFRPPYGRITKFQLKQLIADKYRLKTIMWSVLSGDFDKKISNENCFLNVKKNAKAGSIIVFHDSEKCFSKLSFALPKILEYFSTEGYAFKAIEDNSL